MSANSMMLPILSCNVAINVESLVINEISCEDLPPILSEIALRFATNADMTA